MTTTPSTDAVARVYARSLLELAEQAGQFDEIASEVADFGKLLEKSTDLTLLLEHPTLSDTQRAGAIERVFKGRVSDLMYRFLSVLQHKDRLAALPGIVLAFADLVADRRGLLRIEATFARQPDAQELDRVRSRVGEATGKTVEVTTTIDPALIGGVRLRVGDRLIDASVAGQLKRMRRQLKSAGREQAKGTDFAATAE